MVLLVHSQLTLTSTSSSFSELSASHVSSHSKGSMCNLCKNCVPRKRRKAMLLYRIILTTASWFGLCHTGHYNCLVSTGCWPVHGGMGGDSCSKVGLGGATNQPGSAPQQLRWGISLLSFATLVSAEGMVQWSSSYLTWRWIPTVAKSQCDLENHTI